MLRGLSSGSFVAPESSSEQVASGDEQLTHTNPSNTRVAAIGSSILRVFNRIFCASHGVVPLNNAGIDGQHEPDPRLPFKCEPTRASYHTIVIPDTLIAEPIVVTAIFKVADNGTGLTKAEQARLFKPFSQVCIAELGDKYNFLETTLL